MRAIILFVIVGIAGLLVLLGLPSSGAPIRKDARLLAFDKPLNAATISLTDKPDRVLLEIRSKTLQTIHLKQVFVNGEQQSIREPEVHSKRGVFDTRINLWNPSLNDGANHIEVTYREPGGVFRSEASFVIDNSPPDVSQALQSGPSFAPSYHPSGDQPPQMSAVGSLVGDCRLHLAAIYPWWGQSTLARERVDESLTRAVQSLEQAAQLWARNLERTGYTQAADVMRSQSVVVPYFYDMQAELLYQATPDASGQQYTFSNPQPWSRPPTLEFSSANRAAVVRMAARYGEDIVASKANINQLYAALGASGNLPSNAIAVLMTDVLVVGGAELSFQVFGVADDDGIVVLQQYKEPTRIPFYLSFDPIDSVLLGEIAAHEIGHILGLGHVGKSGALGDDAIFNTMFGGLSAIFQSGVYSSFMNRPQTGIGLLRLCGEPPSRSVHGRAIYPANEHDEPQCYRSTIQHGNQTALGPHIQEMDGPERGLGTIDFSTEPPSFPGPGIQPDQLRGAGVGNSYSCVRHREDSSTKAYRLTRRQADGSIAPLSSTTRDSFRVVHSGEFEIGLYLENMLAQVYRDLREHEPSAEIAYAHVTSAAEKKFLVYGFVGETIEITTNEENNNRRRIRIVRKNPAGEVIEAVTSAKYSVLAGPPWLVTTGALEPVSGNGYLQ